MLRLFAKGIIRGKAAEMNLQVFVDKMLTLKGALAAAIVDYESGMPMASGKNAADFDLEVVAARCSEVMRAKIKTMQRLEMDDEINDIMITLSSQYHFICPVKKKQNMFIYLAVDRKTANVSLCRQMMFAVDKNTV